MSDNYQLELFDETKAGFPQRSPYDGFFRFLHRQEKRFLIIIAIAISCIISFSLGVKKGKQLSVSNKRVSFDLAEQKSATPPVVVTAAAEKIEENKPQRQEKAPPRENYREGYTIQLASYKAKKFADREAEALNKKGVSAFIIYKGDYVVLCAGKFSDKEQARDSMKKLKIRYKDCYLRRL